jgi:hypothetical protein
MSTMKYIISIYVIINMDIYHYTTIHIIEVDTYLITSIILDDMRDSRP